MKILHILASNSFSGAENVVCQIVGMFSDDQSIEMIYCSPDGPIRGALDERGVRFAPISALNSKELRRVIREQRPDLIHAHDMRATFVAALACGKIPLVSHIHGNFSGLNKISPKSLAFAIAARRVRHIFWVSQSSYDGFVFRKCVESKSSVLYNVIDVDALYKKMSSDSNTYGYDVIFLGRICYEKNPERLVRVLKLVADRYPELKAAIVGNGVLFDTVKAQAEELGIIQNVDFLGFRSNPLKILHDSKVMVMTSIREGTPICALEAMALGVPIVSTPTDGMKDLVIDGETGYLSDSDDVLAEKIRDILCDGNLYERLSANTLNRGKEINDRDNYVAKIKMAYGL